eukprot:5545156-Prymnesium_polylepis.1
MRRGFRSWGGCLDPLLITYSLDLLSPGLARIRSRGDVSGRLRCELMGLGLARVAVLGAHWAESPTQKLAKTIKKVCRDPHAINRIGLIPV